VSIPLLALWFVCSLGSAVFAATAFPSGLSIAVGTVAFGVGSWWVRTPYAPSTSVIALTAALVAVAQLVRPPRQPYPAAMSGLLAGVWTGTLGYQGLPSVAAILLAAALPLASARLRARRPGFAPPLLRQEALLFMVVVGIAAAAAPGITDGWHAAVNLSVQGGQAPDATTVPMPVWTLVTASAALLSGGLFSVWSRR
jgi:hypothetical protein